MFKRQLGPFGQRGIQDHGIRLGNQHAGWVAVAIALDLAPRRIWRVFGVAHHFQRGSVE
ncbi:hypothetical protein D3C76_1767190 [compost metagenome]